MSFQRAPLSESLSHLSTWLPKLLPILEQNPKWYGSVWVQDCTTETRSVDLRKRIATEKTSFGIVLRIYDGHTLYERATNQVSWEITSKIATSLAEEVAQNHSRYASLEDRPYQPRTLAERLKTQNLVSEITSQIPPRHRADQPLHFGLRFLKNPYLWKEEEIFDYLEKEKNHCNAALKKEHIQPDFLKMHLTKANEQSIFLDRSIYLTQTLHRMALVAYAILGNEQSYRRIGGLGGLEILDLPPDFYSSIAFELKQLQKAKTLTPGMYRLLTSPSVTGTIAHEAFGHSQEGDTCARGRSRAWELYQSGTCVGNEHATIWNHPALFNHGTLPYGAWGSYFFDEEGWFAEPQLLLEKGYLKPPMTHLLSSLRLKVPRSANGKRESWSHGIYTRQTNTFFDAGTGTFDALLAQVQDGFYAPHSAGGMEDPKGMGIQVGVSYLREIKNGKLTDTLYKGPSGGDVQLTGDTPTLLKNILGKSKIEAFKQTPDQATHPIQDAGGCGKYHKEFVYAATGGPYLAFQNALLG